VLGGIGNALASLLGKMVGKAVGGMKTDAQPKADPKTTVPEKGTPVGDRGDHLLHGVGFATKDKHTTDKNRAEASNMKTFLEHQKEAKEGPEAKLDLGRSPDGEVADRRDAKELRDAKDQDVRRDEAKEDAKGVAQKEAKEERERIETKDKEQKQRDEREEEREKPGGAWVQEDPDEDEQGHERKLRDADELTDQNRCKGILEDGSRCLRKPLKGLSHCREHSASWRPDLNPKA
jgi:hypothetical protein